MISSFTVVHKKGALPSFTSSWYEWKTCLRHIIIGHSENLNEDPHLKEQADVYQGVEAIQFLIEVASGLYSPMVGETEVFGQYKKFITECEYSACGWGTWLRHTLEEIRISVKRVRHQNLIGIGSSSYGSLIRKKTKTSKSIHFIGAGQLVEEIVPWLAKQSGRVNIYCRQPELAKERFLEFPFVQIHPLQALKEQSAGAVVVCAPMEARDIAELTKGFVVDQVMDLRGESRHDPLELTIKVESLDELFAEIEQNKTVAELKVKNARQHIKDLIQSGVQQRKLSSNVNVMMPSTFYAPK